MEDKVNIDTGEVVTQDEYIEMMLHEYEAADKLYRDAREHMNRARMVLFDYMDSEGTNGIPSETYHVRRKSSYDYTKNMAGFLPLMDILNASDLSKVYIPQTKKDGKWNAQQIKVLADIYPKVGEVLERVREAKVTLEFSRREDGK